MEDLQAVILNLFCTSVFFLEIVQNTNTLEPNLKQYLKVSSKFLYTRRKSCMILPEYLDF